MMPQPGYVTPQPARQAARAPRNLLSADRGEIAGALAGHLGDEDAAAELLDFAELRGDGECFRARVTFDGANWTLDLFGEAAS